MALGCTQIRSIGVSIPERRASIRIRDGAITRDCQDKDLIHDFPDLSER